MRSKRLGSLLLREWRAILLYEVCLSSDYVDDKESAGQHRKTNMKRENNLL
jgi:hypothetical protein